MTLQASGAMSVAQIKAELRNPAGSMVFPSAPTRWLSDTPSGSLVLPNSFYSKAGCKVVQTVQAGLGGAGGWTTGISVGTAFASRLLLFVLITRGSIAGLVDHPAMSVNGVAVGRIGRTQSFNGADNLVASIWQVQDFLNTSATVGASFSAGQNAGVLISLSVANCIFRTGQVPNWGFLQDDFNSSAIGFNIPQIPSSNSPVLVVATGSQAGAPAIGGVVLQFATGIATGNISIGFNTQMVFQSNYPVSANWGVLGQSHMFGFALGD